MSATQIRNRQCDGAQLLSDAYEHHVVAGGRWVVCEWPERPIDGNTIGFGTVCPRCRIGQVADAVVNPQTMATLGEPAQALYGLPIVATKGEVLAAMQRLGMPEALAVRRN